MRKNGKVEGKREDEVECGSVRMSQRDSECRRERTIETDR